MVLRGYLLIIAVGFGLFSCVESWEPNYDFVIKGARVLDPETGLDSVVNVGILGDSIAVISASELKSSQVIEATGLVLSPGFIDLHAHGQTNVEHSFQAYDGVTTALELEIGVDSVANWIRNKDGKSLINFGASACQLIARNRLMRKGNEQVVSIDMEVAQAEVDRPFPASGYAELKEKLATQLDQGGIGIGLPLGYLPGASVEEIAALYEWASEWSVPVFSHIREGGAIAFQQAVADAAVTDAQLHICHINSMARKDIYFCLNLVRKAQQQGLKITTELYPYTAGNTEISSAIFREGWQERLGCSYKDLQWVETGERLNEQRFKELRKKGGSVIIHLLEEQWVDDAVTDSITMIASDGGDFTPLGHPRSSGTFCKILRKYVREEGRITLMDAIKKMSLMPAQVLETVVPEMKKRGRIQVGCKADLLLFDPEEIRDNATYEKGFAKSSGVQYLWVNGNLLISEAKLIPDVFPGKAIRGRGKTQVK